MSESAESERPLRVAVFASGGGTNFQALLDHAGPPTPWRIVLLVCDRPDAGAIARARASGVAVAVIDTRGRPQAEVAEEMLAALKRHEVEVIFLAGYLRLVPREIVGRYSRRILNIHPALLPAFGGKGMYGMNVHRAVLESGARITGATVHLVDEEYDRGAILAQWPVPVQAADTPEALAARVLAVEHTLYPRVADHVCRALARGGEPGPMDAAGEVFRLAPSDSRSHELEMKESH